jgi:hypothetical protein
VVMRSRGYLGKVRYREDLMLFRDATQRIPDLQPNAPADSCVHFVEDERRDIVHFRQNGF